MSSTNNATTGGAPVWGEKKGPPSSILQAAAAQGSAGPPPRASSFRGSNRQGSGGSMRGSGGGKGRRDSSASTGGGGRGRRDSTSSQASRRDSSSSQGGGRGGGGRGGRGGGGGRGDSKNKRAPGRQASGTLRLQATPVQEIELYQTVGSGFSDQEKAVVRYSSAKFFSCRTHYLDPPSDDWNPHEKCVWTGPKRIDDINKQMEALWNYKPLEVNDETRWKAKVMKDDDEKQMSADNVEEQLRKATGILNKLSWTNLNKLTVQFLETLGATQASPDGNAAVLSKEVVQATMQLMVDKAMAEPHFSELYAKFCSKLASIHKAFKKTLLSICQTMFEETENDPELPADMDPTERDYELQQSKKRSIGLMQFIGELYKEKLIKGKIMIGCLQRLYVVDDEEKLECFAKLLTTIGQRLHEMEDEPEIQEMWRDVYILAGKTKSTAPNAPVAPSGRIKFLLIDLVDLKENGWVQRRKEEKAKTIAQIHKEVALEERQARQPQQRQRIQRSQSGGAMMQSRSSQQRAPPQSVPDDDGFMQVSKPKKSPLRRSKSDTTSSLQRAAMAFAPPPLVEQPMISEYLEPKECGEKGKSILKEYFIGGDTDDAVLSIEELVGMGHDGDVERGAAIIEAGVLLVMEMKEAEVQKFLTIVSKCLDEEKINPNSLVGGLKDPLEFLRDIEIDAPLAASLLAKIMADWIERDALVLEVLLQAPEYFRTDGRPAEFAAQILAKRGGDVTEADVTVVSSLLSDDAKQANPSVREWLEAAISKYSC